jgi:hypothetical protein
MSRLLAIAAIALAATYALLIVSGPGTHEALAADGAGLSIETSGYQRGAGATLQAQEDSGNADDSRVEVQLYTVLAAVIAAGVGLLLLLARITMGWVKPVPPPEEPHH